MCVHGCLCTCIDTHVHRMCVSMCASMSSRAKRLIWALRRRMKCVCLHETKAFKGLSQGSSLNISFTPRRSLQTLGTGRWTLVTAPGTENPGNRGMPLLNSRTLLCVLKYTQTVDSVKNLTCSPGSFPFSLKKRTGWKKERWSIRKNFRWKHWLCPPNKRGSLIRMWQAPRK